MARDETAKYSDLMPDGKARIFTYRMEAKSVITFPSGGQTLPGPGLYELTGLAWSGGGRIERVEIATDGTGYIQPTREALIAVRGTNSGYHFNGMKFWKVNADGMVTNVDV